MQRSREMCYEMKINFCNVANDLTSSKALLKFDDVHELHGRVIAVKCYDVD